MRSYRYYEFPIPGETEDEVAWTMLGASLIQTGRPTSWSWFSAYNDFIVARIPTPNQNDDGFYYRLVSPALDHPPLFGLIPGSFQSMKNNWDQVPSIKLIRFPMVILGAINVWLLYFVAQKIFRDKNTAHLVALIYATIPTFVFGSRLVVAENLLITWMLITIYLIKSKLKHQNKLLILISVAAILTKVSGIVIPLGIIAFALHGKKDKLLLSGLAGLCLGIVLYVLYGAVFNLQLFLEVNLIAQSGRDLGLATIINRFFLNPAVVEKIFFDGWLVLGLLAMVAWFLVKSKHNLIIKIYSILWLGFNAATAGEQTVHAWYDYPLYPLLALAIAWLIGYLVFKKKYWLVWLSWLLVLPTLRLILVLNHQYWEISNSWQRLLMGLGAMPLGFSYLKNDKLARISLFLLGVLLLVAVTFIVFKINARSYLEMHQFFS